jgi:hypothetical protein
MTAVAFAISGPMYPFPVNQSVALHVIRQLFLGAAAGAQSIVALSCGQDELKVAGFNDYQKTLCGYTSLFWAALQLG